MTHVFTAEVTGCKDCGYCIKQYAASCKHNKVIMQTTQQRIDIATQNYDAITESCPMYQHSFLKDEKK
jgi:hypothetical protein